VAEGLAIGDGDALGDVVAGADGVTEALVDEVGVTAAVGDNDVDGVGDGPIEADGVGVGVLGADGVAVGVTDPDGDTDGVTELDGVGDGDGDPEGVPDGVTEGEGDAVDEGDGELLGVGVTDGEGSDTLPLRCAEQASADEFASSRQTDVTLAAIRSVALEFDDSPIPTRAEMLGHRPWSPDTMSMLELLSHHVLHTRPLLDMASPSAPVRLPTMVSMVDITVRALVGPFSVSNPPMAASLLTSRFTVVE